MCPGETFPSISFSLPYNFFGHKLDDLRKLMLVVGNVSEIRKYRIDFSKDTVIKLKIKPGLMLFVLNVDRQ